MQVTCPQFRALADRTYERPLLRRTKCRYCGYELKEVNVKEAAKIIDLMEMEKEREIDEKIERDVEFLRQKYSEYQDKWLEDHAGISTPIWCRPIPKEHIPPEGYWRVPATLREWLQVLGVKDIDAAEKKVRKIGPFNQWKETAWDLWRRGEI